jgi:hypothetical protein
MILKINIGYFKKITVRRVFPPDKMLIPLPSVWTTYIVVGVV